MKYILKRHPFSKAKKHNVQVVSTLKKDALEVSFEVENLNKTWNTSNKFDHLPMRNWGLWDNDVVELFLQPRSSINDVNAPYFEFQVSPLNQRFQLVIFEPRKVFFTPMIEFFASISVLEKNKWKITFVVPKFWTEKYLYMGMFACLGKDREFFSANLNPESKPDFHRPELFLI